MAFESRGKHRYLYVSTRVGSQVKKTYHGRTLEAGLVAIELRKRAECRLKERRELREAEAQDWAITRRMQLVREAAKEAIHVAYLGANYCKSECYHWRKIRTGEDVGRKPERRQPSKKKRTRKAKPKPPEAAKAQSPNAEQAWQLMPMADDVRQRRVRIRETIIAITEGRNELRTELRRLLLEEDENFWAIADVVQMTMDQWAARIAPDKPFMRESILLQAIKERDQLTPDGSSAVERVLADRLILSKLQQQYYGLQEAAIGADKDVLGSKIGQALTNRVKSANHELREATKHYEKAKQLKAEVAPKRPYVGAVALKLYDPKPKKKKVA